MGHRPRRRAGLLLLPVLAALAVVVPRYVEAATGCRSDTMANVWQPSRLKILSRCTTVHGVIKSSSKQANGDYHIGMRLDSGVTIRIEIVPADQPGCRAGDKVRYGVCTGAHIPTPRSGSKVYVTGPKVRDSANGGTEIHPVWRITSE